MSDSPLSLEPLHPAHQRRLDWAMRDLRAPLIGALQRDLSPEAARLRETEAPDQAERIARLIMERADPTDNKRFTAWLVREYAAGRLILEDLGSAHETLTLFQRYAPRLKPDQRDIHRYASLAAAWEAVRGFAEREEAHSNKAQKALDRAKAYEESRILRQDPDGFTVAVPMTEFAAKWWGRGTRWCTAAEKENAFLEYHETAPLIVTVFPWLGAKGKFQFWVTKNEAQFMDAADEPVSEVLLAEHFSRFVPGLSFALRQNCRALLHIPEALRTAELCRIAVAQKGVALEYVPQVLRTGEICKIAAAQNGRALRYVPEPLLMDEICQIAVTQNGQALDCVPVDLRTEELCRIAVVQDGWALRYVPEKLRTEDLCKIAVAQTGEALEDVPRHLRTQEMCTIAVAQNGWALNHVPEDLRTEEMCRIAVAQDGRALKYVPIELRTDDMCRSAVAQHGRALAYVPGPVITDEMCRIAVAQNGYALQSVLERLRTNEMCRIAVARHGRALHHVPKDLRTDEICRIALAQNGLALEYVPRHLRTEEMCRIAVAQNGGGGEYVPQDLRDRMKALIPPPVPEWDISLLEELASLLGAASSTVLSGPRHA